MVSQQLAFDYFTATKTPSAKDFLISEQIHYYFTIDASDVII